MNVDLCMNRYRVSTKGIWAEGEILIRIYPAAYWDLLQIRRNQTLYVEESTSVIISREILEVSFVTVIPQLQALVLLTFHNFTFRLFIPIYHRVTLHTSLRLLHNTVTWKYNQ